MKKLIIIILLFIQGATVMQAQYVTQSADGKGTIPLPMAGVGLGMDIGKTEISVGLNNYSKVLSAPDNSNNFFLGLNLSVKNSEGIGNLFSSGDIVPAGEFLGFLGYTFSNNKAIIKKWNESPIVINNSISLKLQHDFFLAYKMDVLNSLKVASGLIFDDDIAVSLQNTLREKIDSAGDYRKVVKNIEETQTRFPQDSLKKFWSQFNELILIDRIKAMDKFDKQFTTEKVKAEKQAFDETVKTITPFRITPFLLGGINARSFNLFTKTTPVNFGNSFIDTLFRGGTIGVGINTQWKNFWLGITYSYIDGDNFTTLTSKEYTLKTVDTSGNQSLSREKKTTAYSGNYSKVETNQLNADLIWDIKINDTSRLLANAYVRGSLFSRDTAYLKNYTNVGLGLYFLGKKSKFLGGLYIELPDVTNNVEKAKPIDERNFRPTFKKLTFGVVVKYGLSSILNFQNTPRKPD